MKNIILQILLVLLLTISFSYFIIFILTAMDEDVKRTEEEKHKKYIEAMDYCLSKNKDVEEIKKCINMIVNK